MQKMKSLAAFAGEAKNLNSAEMKNVTGGMNEYTWEVTTTTAGDRDQYCQEYRWDGSAYVKYGPKYKTGKTMTYLG